MTADVATTLASWSTTAASNAPSGSTAISTNLDDNLRQIQAVVRTQAAADTIASATTTDLSTKDNRFLTVSGTTTITGLGTVSAGISKWLVFSGALTLTHNASSLILPTAANITTAAGDCALMLSLGSGNWRCLTYMKANGGALGASLVAPGTVAAPGYGFSTDTNTGIYGDGSDTVSVATGGANAGTFDSTKLTVPKLYFSQSGTNAAPSIVLSTDTDTGIYSAGADLFAIASGGTLVASFAPTLVRSHVAFQTTALTASGAANLQSTVTAGGAIRASNGTGALPGISFTSETGTGLAYHASNKLTISEGGTTVVYIRGGGGSSRGVQIYPGEVTSGNLLNIDNDAAAGTGYNLIECRSATATLPDTEWKLRGDGAIFTDGTTSISTPADYAEMFEWADGNPNAEDRVGYSVALVGNQVRIAQPGDEPIGVVSGNPAVLGDAGSLRWVDKYLRDAFNRPVLNADGTRALNPAFDPAHSYTPRIDRPEWSPVGLVGKLRVRAGQVVGSRWVKMRDISNDVAEYLVR